MRILTVSPNLGVGGLERVSVDLANALVADGAEIVFAAPDGALATQLDARIERISLPDRGRTPAATAATITQVARGIRAVRPDVVHAHNVRMTGIAGVSTLLAGLRRPALVGTFHGVDPGEDRATAAVLRLATEVACVSEALAARLRVVGRADRVTVIPNAVAAVPPLQPAERAALDAELRLAGRPVVASVGRFMPVKAPDRFVEMAATAAARAPEAVFLMVGDGPLRPALQQRVAALGLSDAFRFTGWRSDARHLVARADVLVVSSDSEGLSVVSLEALSAGVPVVSTPVSGMHELLESGAGVVTARHDASELADAVVALLRAPEDRRRRGAAGRALVERLHGLPEMVRRYADLFERAAASGRSAPKA